MAIPLARRQLRSFSLVTCPIFVRAGFLLAIEVQGPGLGKRLPGIGLGPDDVFHHRIGMADGITKGHPATAGYAVRTGKLTGLDGPMAAIVTRGAISLTNNAPPWPTNNSTAKTPT
jgi:hypothetical protein